MTEISLESCSKAYINTTGSDRYRAIIILDEHAPYDAVRYVDGEGWYKWNANKPRSELRKKYENHEDYREIKIENVEDKVDYIDNRLVLAGRL